MVAGTDMKRKFNRFRRYPWKSKNQSTSIVVVVAVDFRSNYFRVDFVDYIIYSEKANLNQFVNKAHRSTSGHYLLMNECKSLWISLFHRNSFWVNSTHSRNWHNPKTDGFFFISKPPRSDKIELNFIQISTSMSEDWINVSHFIMKNFNISDRQSNSFNN